MTRESPLQSCIGLIYPIQRPDVYLIQLSIIDGHQCFESDG